MKKIKWIIILSVLGVLIGLFVLLSFTFFGLHTIEVDFRTSHQVISEQQVLSNITLKKNCPIYFQNKKKCTNKIEETLPYAKVINIESVFPSKIIIHVAERNEVYAIEDDDKTYICDDDLRVLRKETSFSSTEQNAMLLNLEEKLNGEYEVGDYINVNKMPSIYQTFYSLNRGLGEQIEIIESITESQEYDEVLKKNVGVLTLKLFSGKKVKFYNVDNYLKEKAKMFIDVYSQLFDYIGMNLKVGEGQYKELSEEDLKNCTIAIYDRYIVDKDNSQFCYFNILLND